MATRRSRDGKAMNGDHCNRIKNGEISASYSKFFLKKLCDSHKRFLQARIFFIRCFIKIYIRSYAARFLQEIL